MGKGLLCLEVGRTDLCLTPFLAMATSPPLCAQLCSPNAHSFLSPWLGEPGLEQDACWVGALWWLPEQLRREGRGCLIPELRHRLKASLSLYAQVSRFPSACPVYAQVFRFPQDSSGSPDLPSSPSASPHHRIMHLKGGGLVGGLTLFLPNPVLPTDCDVHLGLGKAIEKQLH